MGTRRSDVRGVAGRAVAHREETSRLGYPAGEGEERRALEQPDAGVPDRRSSSSSQSTQDPDGIDDEDAVRARRFEALREGRRTPLVLLVDDEQDSRDAVAELLSTRFAVVSAADGEQAVELARERAPDLIVMDVVMPRLSGVGAFDALLNDPRTADIPVIFLSAQSDEWTTALCLNRGAADYVPKPASGRELFARIDRALRETRERHALQAMAQTDALTGLANFRALSARLDQEIKRAVRYQYPLSAVMIDLDNLKPLNDRFGHETGNRAIVALARHLKHNLRETDFAARFGGDEFVVLLPHQTASDAAIFAERIRAGVRDLQFRADPAGEEDVLLSISAGVACRAAQDGRASGEELLRAADSALYRAKRDGRDRVLIGEGNLSPAQGEAQR